MLNTIHKHLLLYFGVISHFSVTYVNGLYINTRCLTLSEGLVNGVAKLSL